MYQFKMKDAKQETLPEICGGIIGCLFVMCCYLAVPVGLVVLLVMAVI